MKERFEKDGHHNLIDALKRQEFVAGNVELANALAKSGQLVEFHKGDKLITEGGEDNDIYLLLSGSVAVVVKGNDIRTANDGHEALEIAETFHPELVLLDIGLPRLNGYEVAHRIRQQPWGRDAILVAMTGWGQDEDRRRSLEAGFNFHAVKPVELAALEELLAGHDCANGGPSMNLWSAPTK